LIVFCPSFSLAQDSQLAATAAPADLSKWDLICFCTTSVNTPHFAVRADTNGQILYYAQSGATKAQIQQAIGKPLLTSQLVLLQDWRLLRRSGEVYTTSIPVLGPEKIGQLREQMRNLASNIAPAIRPDVEQIASDLEHRNLSDHLYSVLFSYVLDGLTWDELKADKAIPELQITASHPFWDGTFWALYPSRTAQPGTNSSGSDGITILMTWTDPVLSQLNTLQNTPSLMPALQRAARGDCQHLTIEDKAQHRWDLARPDGSCALPVIHENANDLVYVAGVRIAKRIANAVQVSDFQTLIGGGVTPQQAHLIEAHELMWEVLDALVQQGIVQQPAVLKEGSTDPAKLLLLLVVTVQEH
jgi:hypothetical protein